MLGHDQSQLEYGNVRMIQRNEDLSVALGVHPATGAFCNNIIGHRAEQNVSQVVEQILNRFGFNVGYANQPYFVSSFPDWVQQAKIPKGVKILKLSKFAGEGTESTVEHIAYYTIEMGELDTIEILKMRFFPSLLTKNVFSWFLTLRPNSVHSWAQLGRSLHDQFFRGVLKT